MEENNQQLTEVQQFQQALVQLETTSANILDSTNTVVTSVGDIVHCVADTVKQVQMIERQFHFAMAKMDNDLERFKASLPSMEKQFDRIQTRLDVLTNQIMSMHRPDMSDNDLHCINSCLRAMEMNNATLNNLLSSLF